MLKYILASATALALVAAPLSATAEDSGGSGPHTEKMKGSPNASGYEKKGDNGSDSKDSGGAGSDKSTAGSDK